MGLSDIPVDITQLTMLEQINVSNNKLNNLKRIEQLPNLKKIDASNNQISALHQEMLDMWSIESLYLYGNPIVNTNPQLAQIENNQDGLKKALQQYFGGAGGSSIQGLSSGGLGGQIGGNYGLSGGSGGFSTTALPQNSAGGGMGSYGGNHASTVGLNKNFGAGMQPSAYGSANDSKLGNMGRSNTGPTQSYGTSS